MTLGLIGKMLQSFIVGNLLIGLLISGVSVAIFGLLHVPFFYFVGFLSGFLSLVPYLGYRAGDSSSDPGRAGTIGAWRPPLVVVIVSWGCIFSRSMCSIRSCWAAA